MGIIDLTFEIEKAVNDYYKLDDGRREYLKSILNHNPDISWKRVELIKALMLFNRATEENMDVHDPELDAYVKAIDNNNQMINRLVINYDNAKRASIGLPLEEGINL